MHKELVTFNRNFAGEVDILDLLNVWCMLTFQYMVLFHKPKLNTIWRFKPISRAVLVNCWEGMQRYACALFPGSRLRRQCLPSLTTDLYYLLSLPASQFHIYERNIWIHRSGFHAPCFSGIHGLASLVWLQNVLISYVCGCEICIC